jgi:uncharacterized protein
MTPWIIDTVRWFLLLTAEMVVLFLAVSFLIGLLQVWLPEARLRALLARPRPSTSYITAVTLGAVTPFCSYSTIPVLLGLLRSGAPFGPTMAFLMASPILDPLLLVLLVTVIGLPGTIVYASATFLLSIVVGVVWARLGLSVDIKAVGLDACGTVTTTAHSPWQSAWQYAWRSLMATLPYLLLGTAAGALIYGLAPAVWIASLVGPDQPLAIPLAAVLGVPLYVGAETLIPIVEGLQAKGMSTGAVVALTVTAMGAGIPEFMLLVSIFRARLMWAFALSIFVVAIVSGALVTLAVG